MNEQDKKILELYLKDSRRKKIFLFAFVIVFIIGIIFYSLYTKYRDVSKEIDNTIQEETKINIINENIANEETTPNIENTTVEENVENQNKVDEQTEEIKQDTKEEKEQQETIDKSKTQVTTSSSNNNEKNTKEKPKNKDFLFTDGYTMDNVTQVAQDYLKSYDFSGECVPIKDNEGVYLGMRVIFY